MPGDIAARLVGAQGGGEDDFRRLYELSNPLLVRYLRVVSDADAADLALTSWATLVRRLPSCAAQDEAWLEQLVGSARLSAEDARQRGSFSDVVDPQLHLPYLVLADLEGDAAASEAELEVASTAAGDAAAAHTPPAGSPDDLDGAIEALRALSPEEAEVLAMRGIARLGHGSISRITGLDVALVVDLVKDGFGRVPMPVHTLLRSLRSPGRPEEVADLPAALRLFTGTSLRPQGAAASAAAVAPLAAAGLLAKPSAIHLFDTPASATTAATGSTGGAAGAAGTTGAAGAAATGAAGTAGAGIGWAGATAAAAALAIGGVGIAAWNGLFPGLFGGPQTHRAPSAVGPSVPGPLPEGGTEGRPGQGNGPHPGPSSGGRQEPGGPTPGAGGTDRGTGTTTVSLGRVQLAVQVVSVVDGVGGPSVVVPGAGEPPAPAGSPPMSTPPASKPPTSTPPTSKPSSRPPAAKPPASKPPAQPGKSHSVKAKPGKAKPAKAKAGQNHGKGKALAKGHTKPHPGKALAKGHTKPHPGKGSAKPKAKQAGSGPSAAHHSGRAQAAGHAKQPGGKKGHR